MLSIFSNWLLRKPVNLYYYAANRALLSLAISYSIALVLKNAGVELYEPNTNNNLFLFSILALIISPLIENYLLLILIIILNKKIEKEISIAVISTVVFSLLHSLVTPAWGLLVFAQFLVFSCTILMYYQDRRMFGYLLSVSIHSLCNLPATLSYFIY